MNSFPVHPPCFELQSKRVYVAGHTGMVGRAVVRRLASESCHVLTASRSELDLENQEAVRAWFAEARPDVVILAAAKVGGISANDTYPADFLYENLMIEANVIHAAFKANVEKLIFLGSSCIYPKFADQPIQEDSLLTGALEPTNEWYAIAKIAGLKLCAAYRKQHGADFISCMPTNLYGPYDNFELQSSHVLPALIRKVHEAKTNGAGEITIWGSGRPRREFLFVDDCADAIVFLLKHYSADKHVNVGTGSDISIRELAALIADTLDHECDVETDPTMPDGTPRKLLNVDLLSNLGWRARTDLKDGIAKTYTWFLEHQELIE